MKSAIHITLLSLWICALVVPSFATILNRHENPVIVLNLNEEEQQEQSKTDAQEKQMICSQLLPHSPICNDGGDGYYAYYMELHGELPQEIHLPPPEMLS